MALDSTLRLNMTSFESDPELDALRYQAAIEMAAYVDVHGFNSINVEEHHCTEIGWLPSPLIMASAIAARTKQSMVSVCALLVPLYDPVRLAEDIAVLDLISGGRFSFIAGLGYRREEYNAHNVCWSERGKLMDHAIEVMLKAWSGEPFDYHGNQVRVTPVPKSRPHPFFFLGGASIAAAKRAARFGLPFFPPRKIPEINEAYYVELKKQGNEEKGFVLCSDTPASMVFVSEDPDQSWDQLGKYFLRELSVYTSWITDDRNSLLKQKVTTIEELRALDFFKVLTPEQCLQTAQESDGRFILHPLAGGVPIDDAWQCLHLYVEKVLSKI